MMVQRMAALIVPLFRPDTSGSSSARTALQRLMMLRALVTFFTVTGTLIFDFFSPLAIPAALVPGLLLVVVLTLLLVAWRLRQPWLVTTVELLAHLLTDVGLLLIILSFTGGASNPLISYLLVLLAVGATLLTQRFMALFTSLAIALYTLFLVAELRTEEMDHANHAAGTDFQLHLVGMWVIFVVSAILITVFITRMAAGIRSRELALAAVRETELRNEQLVAIGTLAAGTAHALGTPLSTMSVLLSELDEAGPNSPAAADDIRLLREQVERCRGSLQQLTRFYNENSIGPEQQTLSQLRDSMQDYLINVHPRAQVCFEMDSASADALIPTDMSLKHALINIIENAIKAAREKVLVTLQRTAAGLEIRIRDDGPGIPPQVMENLGEPFISTRKGMGLGIFLANAAIQRLGGTIRIFNLEAGGAESIICLPALAEKPSEVKS